MLNKTNHVGRTHRPTYAKSKTRLAFENGDIFRMLLQGVWQTAYTKIFRDRQIFGRNYFRAYKRIRFGLGFTVLTCFLYSPVLEYVVALVYQLAHQLSGLRLLFTVEEQGAEHGGNASWSDVVTLGPVTVLVKMAQESEKIA
jgi:hypothetical protein